MLPKRGSRRVTVHGALYRWREGRGRNVFELRVEAFDEPRQTLLVQFEYRYLDPDHPQRVYRPIMTVRVLEAAIGLGLTCGWTPDKAGPLVTIPPSRAASLVTDYDYRYVKWTNARPG